MTVCNRCGWWDRFCKCSGTDDGLNIITHDWITRTKWEHIDPKNPNMRVSSKAELIHECAKRGLVPKAFMKRKSQGKGVEVR